MGQECFTWNGRTYPPGTQGIMLMDTAGLRPVEWMANLPYPFVPIVRAVIVRAAGDGDYTVSIDRAQTEVNLAQPPYYQAAVSTPQSWYLNQNLVGLTGDPAHGHPVRQQQTFTPPVIMDRRHDSIWVDSNNYGTITNTVGFALCWDADLAATLNAGYTPSGWLTSAGLVVGDGGSNGWGGYTLAVTVAPGLQTASRSIELINTGGSQVRVTFAAGVSDMPVTKTYIGTTTSAMTQLKFGGNAGVTIPANTQLTSDGVAFSFDATKTLLVKALCGTAASVRFASYVPGWNSFYKSGDDASTTSLTGYSASGANVIGVVRVETFH